MRARSSRRSAMTLVEMMVATTVLVMLVGLAVGSLLEATGPTIEGSVRGYMLSIGDAAIVKLEREISSADFASAAEVVGAWDGATLTPSTSGTGDALQLFPVTGWDTASGSITTATGVVYQFRPTPLEGANGVDDDRDGLVDELQLVRIDTASGLVITVLEDVLSVSTATTEQARFTQVGFTSTPVQRAQLELRFTLSRRVGLDEFVTLTFAKVITLRNVL